MNMIEPKAGYHHGDLRAQLVEAVRGLIERDGPDDFSVAEASRLAGVSSGAPYKHFKDRDAILKAVALGGLQRLGERMAAASDSRTYGTQEAIDAIGLAYVQFALDEPAIFRMMFGMKRKCGPDENLEATGMSAYSVLIGNVAAYRGLGADDPIVQRDSHILWTIVHGHATLRIDGMAKAGTEATTDEELIMDAGRRVLAPLSS